MMRLEVIGNLGADAEIKDVNGRKFVSFRIAHTDKWVDSQTQQAQTTTQWVSCAINGDGGKLVPYLKKGTKVFVRGSVAFGTFNSAKSHQIECAVNLSVWEIELCGSKKEESQEPQTNQSNQASQTATTHNVAQSKKKNK